MEARDRCLGQENCCECPYFMDTCNGKIDFNEKED